MQTSNKLLHGFIIIAFAIFMSCNNKQEVSERSNANNTKPPHLQTVNGVTRLSVNNKPFLSLAGELRNSSSSSLEYMDTIWTMLVQMNLNTVLAPVSWELIEPQEGQFCFDLVDGLIENARKNDLKIVFLWFGSWKNMVSTYAPGWVKKSPDRFPLFVAKNGERFQMLSSFSEENMRADSRAFAALMNHIKLTDSIEQTVIMMQVENEVGTNGGQRDHSKVAVKAYENEVSEKLMSYIQKNSSSLIPEFKQVWAENGYRTKGTWGEIFGEGAAGNEIFMAWHLAGYIGGVIKAGKERYNIPVFVNASVGRQDQKLATYPSGGPVPFVMDIWHAAAPELDMLCPDIYYGDFTEHCQKYTQSGNPLFIPETRAGERGAANALLAYGNFNAIGFSPFGIESWVQHPVSDEPIPQIYDVLDQLSHLVLKSESKKQMIAFSVDSDNPVCKVELGRYQVNVSLRARRETDRTEAIGYAILINLNPDEFIAAGKNIDLQFSPANEAGKVTGILLAEEGKFENRIWIPGRRLNGDEIMVNYSFSDLFWEGKSGNGLEFSNSLNIQRVELYNY